MTENKLHQETLRLIISPESSEELAKRIEQGLVNFILFNDNPNSTMK